MKLKMGNLSRFSLTAVLSALCAFLAASLRSRAALQIEILALRHQLNVLQRSVKRPRLSVVRSRSGRPRQQLEATLLRSAHFAITTTNLLNLTMPVRILLRFAISAQRGCDGMELLRPACILRASRSRRLVQSIRSPSRYFRIGGMRHLTMA